MSPIDTQSGLAPIPVTRLDQADPDPARAVARSRRRGRPQGRLHDGRGARGLRARVRRLLRHRSSRSASPPAPRRSRWRCARSTSARATRSSSRRTHSSRRPRPSAWVGATAKLVDVDPETHLITAEHVAAAIGPNTKAVIPVHLMGSTVDMDPILELARAARAARDRGHRPGARRLLQGPARRLDGRHRLLLVLPHQEPRRLGRRRRDRDQRRGDRASTSCCCARTASPRATTTGSSARPRASTRCRPRSCA